MEDFTFNDFETFVSEVTNFSGQFSKMQHRDDISYELKDDKTPVTDTDLQIECLLRKAIENLFPTHAISGEEFPDLAKKSNFKWIIDPIDGTFSFTKSVPLFGILVGLLYGSSPRFGCLRFPLLGNKLIVGDGEKAFENGRLIQSSKNVSLKESLILTTDENRIRKSNYQTSWNKLSESIAYHRTWGDCYGYYLVCSGKAQVMFDVGLKPCDILPLIPIIRGAGCEIVELRKPYQDIIVCSRDVYQEVVNFF